MVQLPTGYRFQPVTDWDREFSLVCWGFTIGFGILTTRGAWKQTTRVSRKLRLRSRYIWYLWADTFASFGFGCAVWLYMQRHVEPGFPLFLIIVCLYVIQIHSQLQIIINRLSMIMPNKRRAKQLRLTVAGTILLINIMVATIWIPAAMEVDPIFAKINKFSGRAQKVIYLVVDASLNYYFVRLINQQTVKPGLAKYKPLVKFNTRIAALSVAMDLIIIGMMSYPSIYVFMSLHTPAFFVKLNIEMSMADLILRIAKSKECTSSVTSTTASYELSYYAEEIETDNYNHNIGNDALKFATDRNQEAGLEAGSQASFAASSGDQIIEFENDEQPLHGTQMYRGSSEIEIITGDGRAN